MVLSFSKPTILTHLCQLPAQHTTQSQRCIPQRERPLTAWAAWTAGAGEQNLQCPGTPGSRATLSCGVGKYGWQLHISAAAAASCLLLPRQGGARMQHAVAVDSLTAISSKSGRASPWAAMHMPPSADSHTSAPLWHRCCRSAEASPSRCALEGFGSRDSSRALQHIRQQVLLAQQQLFNPRLHSDDGGLFGQGGLRRHKQRSSRGLGTTRHSSPSLVS